MLLQHLAIAASKSQACTFRYYPEDVFGTVCTLSRFRAQRPDLSVEVQVQSNYFIITVNKNEDHTFT